MEALPGPEPTGPASTFWASATQLLGLLVDAVYTRLELLFLDLQEGVDRLARLLIWSLIALFAATMTLLLGSLALIFVFWETHRVLVASCITGFFALLTLLALSMAAAGVRARRQLFSATMQEFARDREALRRRGAPHHE